MAKAKSKVQAEGVKAQMATPQERVNAFAKAVQEASDKYQIGLSLRLLSTPEAIKPDLQYVDLVELKQKQDEQNQTK